MTPVEARLPRRHETVIEPLEGVVWPLGPRAKDRDGCTAVLAPHPISSVAAALSSGFNGRGVLYPFRELVTR